MAGFDEAPIYPEGVGSIRLAGTETGKAFEIISYGADGEEGGEGLNADLYSTDAF